MFFSLLNKSAHPVGVYKIQLYNLYRYDDSFLISMHLNLSYCTCWHRFWDFSGVPMLCSLFLRQVWHRFCAYTLIPMPQGHRGTLGTVFSGSFQDFLLISRLIFSLALLTNWSGIHFPILFACKSCPSSPRANILDLIFFFVYFK